MSKKLSSLSLSDLERIAYNDPNDPTAPPASLIKAAAQEIERRDSLKFRPPAYQIPRAERINGIRI